MKDLKNEQTAIIFIPKDSGRELGFFTLLSCVFDYDLDFIINQIGENSGETQNPQNTNFYKDNNSLIRNKANSKHYDKLAADPIWAETINKFIKRESEKNVDINWIIQTLNSVLNFCSNGITVGIEYQYVDKVYRDSYYTHIGGEHFNKSRFCKRLALFNGEMKKELLDISEDVLQKNFIGSIVVRPTKEKAIGRCLLSPYYFRQSTSEEVNIRVSKYNITFYGIKLHVEAFPFEMQDGITTTCAEITLLNLLDYYSNEFQDYQFVLPSALKQIIKKLSTDRVTPATGISYGGISKVLYQTGFTPKFYRDGNNIKATEIIQMLSFYVESGIPVAIGMNRDETERSKGHSVICIGHGSSSNEKITEFVKVNTPSEDEIKGFVANDKEHNEDKDRKASLKRQTVVFKEMENHEIKTLHRVFSYVAIDQFIIQDDLNRPYNIMEPDIECGTLTEAATDKKWYVNCIVAPLYKRMHIDAKQARGIIDHILMSKLGPINKGTSAKDCIVVRLFLASSKNLQNHRIKSISNIGIRNMYRSTPFPKFVWVAELYDIKKYPDAEAFGEIILDATNAEGIGLESVVMVNYNSRHLARDRDGANITQEGMRGAESFDFGIFLDKDKCTYKPYNHNLTVFSDEKQKQET